jgi:hypothetical protein
MGDSGMTGRGAVCGTLRFRTMEAMDGERMIALLEGVVSMEEALVEPFGDIRLPLPQPRLPQFSARR